ncbi:MAG: hypothetical protein QM296_00485 [Bacillota bacterium]|nr:hypothetical protein [Bacillota bacterium]
MSRRQRPYAAPDATRTGAIIAELMTEVGRARRRKKERRADEGTM